MYEELVSHATSKYSALDQIDERKDNLSRGMGRAMPVAAGGAATVTADTS